MKEKIIAALSNKYANLGVGRKALDGVASFIEKNVATEEDIENAVAGSEVLILLKAIQGETDSLRQKNAQMTKKLEELEGKPNPTPTPEPTPKPESEVEKMLKQILEKQTATEKRINDFEAKTRREALMKEAEDLMVKNGSTNAFIRGLAIKGLEIGEEDTAATLAERGKTAYDENYRKAYGDGPVPPMGDGGGNEGYKKGMYSDMAKQFVKSGRLPKADE